MTNTSDFNAILDSMTLTATGKASALAPHAEAVKNALASADLPPGNMGAERAREIARIVSGDVEESRLLAKAVRDGKADATILYRAEVAGFCIREPDSRIARAESLREQIRQERAAARAARKGNA